LVARPFTLESLPADLADPALLATRTDMLLFVGEYLLDFERAAEAEGLTLAQARVLGFAVTPSSMRDIAYQFGCDPSNITAKIDRLVGLGLVERQPDPQDARVKRIAATERGVQTAIRLCQRRTWLGETLKRLNKRELKLVRDALKLLRRVDRP
jgi:DNA-binding MarR family transcriptional regulator